LRKIFVVLLFFTSFLLILYYAKLTKTAINKTRLSSNQNTRSIDEIKKVFEVLDRNKIDDSVIITQTNYGFIEILMNLLASLQMNNYDKFVIFCIDEHSFDYLKSNGFELNIVMVPIEWTGGIKLSSNFENFKTPSYNKIINYRPRLYYELLLKGNLFLIFSS